MNEKALKIDVEEVFLKKNKGLAKIIPGFIFRYLKRIIHQDEINEFMANNYKKQDIEFANAILEGFDLSYEIVNPENIEKDGRFIFVSNHPLGGPDGIILISAFSKYFPKIKFLVNDILMNIKNLAGVFIPINKHGGQARESAKIIDEAYSSDACMLSFPAGLVSRKTNGKIRDLEWKKSFIAKSIKYKRNVVPVFISGNNSKFFYRLANFRKFIGLKSNLEMLYLPDELFKQKANKFKVYIGKPIPYSYFDKSKTQKQWAEYVKNKVYQLPED
ncbi:MAG: 1-acyl-sn-glycerol-3-phosphate acyltransferase [Marinifilaceae bacterium]|jgi:putative hemolysin|nr:1-acyl-sn-glycerol-3-phosphate acyltransferase [Marinifilaceae bacterium]